MELPVAFCERMEKMLGEEYSSFIQSYENKKAQALRVNTLKCSMEEFMEISPYHLRSVPWVAEGFYYDEEQRPGKHPFHEAGLYYIQEPSAMAVATLAGVKPGERILDLCAAPGGKTTQLAAYLQGEGLLVSNEIHPARSKILSQNVERMGIRNAVVMNETPNRLEQAFPEYFDRVIVDAPCSGEGMFRKDEEACIQWSPANVEMCATRQQEILNCAAGMLREGGTLVYSTCTFAPEEDEGSIAKFLEKHADFRIKKVSAYPGFTQGRPEWADGQKELAHTFRLWPHRIEGEGHYIAILERIESGEGMDSNVLVHKEKSSNATSIKKMPQINRTARGIYEKFLEENLVNAPKGETIMFGDQIYLLPTPMSLKGLKVVRPGLHVGTVVKDRFEPSHALALALRKEDVRRVCNLELDDKRVTSFLMGEALPFEGEKGWTVVCVNHQTLGWGKASSGVLKNHYPKGLRWV